MPDIIIVNYNSTDYLLGCLRSIEKDLKRTDATIFVQDNASSDHVQRVRFVFPEIILTRNPRNLGFAKAVNQALIQGNGEYIILLNPDTLICKGFFESALRFMKQHSDVGIMGPAISDTDGKRQHSARSFPTPMTALFGRSSLLSAILPGHPITCRNLLSLMTDGVSPMEADWVSGACMVIRRDAIDAVGLLDERFFMYWEDADWCRRMWDSGWKVVYFPQCMVYHEIAGSSRTNIVRSVLAFHKSIYHLFDKYSNPWLTFLKPLVLAGLAIRSGIMICLRLMQQRFKTGVSE